MSDHVASFRLIRLLLVVFATGLVTGWSHSFTLRVGDQIDFHVPASLLVPLAAACLMTGAVIDPVGPVAATSTRPLPALAAGRVGACVLFFTLGLCGGLATVGAPLTAVAVVVRNTGLLLGLCLATLCLVDLALAWLPACAYSIICMAAGARPDGTRDSWAVLLELEGQAAAPWIAAGLALLGGAVGTLGRIRLLQAR